MTTTKTRTRKPKATKPQQAVLDGDCVVVDARALGSAISAVMPAVPARPSHPILNTIKMVVADSKIVLSAFDLNKAISKVVDCQIPDGLTAQLCAPARLFADTVAAMPSGELQLKIDGLSIELISGKIRLKINCQDTEQFPELPAIEADSFSLSVDILHGIGKLAPFVSDDQTGPALEGVNICIQQGTVKAAATDGHRLSSYQSTIDDTSISTSLLIPGAVFRDLEKLSADSIDDITVLVDPTHAFFSGKKWTLITRTIEGQFPEWERLMPKQFGINATVSQSDALSAIKRILIISAAASKDPVIRFDFTDVLTVQAKGLDVGDGLEELEVGIEGSQIKISFRGAYVASAIGLFDASDEVTIYMNSPTSPAVFKSHGSPITTLVMPIQERE